MVRFEYEDRKYRVSFYYVWQEGKSVGLRRDWPTMASPKLRRVACIAEVWEEHFPVGEEPQHTLLVVGESRCHPKDEFNKDLARRMALGRAIDLLEVGFRSAVWLAYSRMKGRA